MSYLVPNDREIVTSVGSAWIICRSKSFAGRIYYFNTLTGEAVWNLSETEVEKAKRRTKIIQNQPGFVIENCPEPPESPKDDPTSNKLPSSSINWFPQHNIMIPAKVNNKQVIKNRFPTTTALCAPHLQYHACNPMNPIQSNNPVAPVLNPLIWNAAPQQIFGTPTYSQPQPTSDNNYDHVYLNNMSNTPSNSFTRLSGVGHLKKKIQIRHNKYQHHKSPKKCRENKLKKNNNKIDLRLILSLKRRENQLKEEVSQLRANAAAMNNNKYKQGVLDPLSTRIRRESNYCFDPNEEEHIVNDDDYKQSNFTHKDKKQNGPHPPRIRRRSYSFNANEENNDFLEQVTIKNSGTSQSEEDSDSNAWLEAKLKRNSTSLSQVTENTDVTYIVPDSNVFLKNINLLDDILNTDKECCLLVPKMVMNKIQAATKSHCPALAYKALYFIWQQHEANFAIIEEEECEQNESNEDDLLNFCCQLIDQDIRVVLVTDDTELINSNNTYNTNIRIITTVKMQQLVDVYKCNETTTTNIDTEELAHVKIIVENKSNIQHNEEVIKSPMRKCMNSEKSIDEAGQSENRGADVFQKDKKACDVGVQASCNFPSVSSPSNTDVRDEVRLPVSTKAIDCVPRKTGGIKLKRNVSTDSKKNTCNSYNTNLTFLLANDRTKAGNGVESTYPITDSTVNKNTLSDGKNVTWSLFSDTSTDSYKNNEGSDTSSIVFRNVNQRENITIEDSSSVISNTTSNVDTESERGGVRKADTNIDDTIVMFEVSDSRMEEALRVNMEVLVPRFVRIMEEALSRLLAREAPLEAPTTLHEAAECVREHFGRDPDVLAAAARLLAVSRDHGGLRGKIKSNMSPHKYMQLYSYGVYLIDALQGVFSSNEDLQTASEALAKLMDDIQQSHSDPGAEDSFTDISAQECDANVTADKDTSQVEATQGAKKQEVVKGSPIRNNKKQSPASTPSTPNKYNLRSQRKKRSEENRESSDNVTFIRTIDPESSFFSSLDLKKISYSDNANVAEKPQQIIGSGTTDNIQEKSPSLQTTNEHIKSSEKSTASILNGDPKMNEPKIIRNFFKSVEYEDKLKDKTGLLDNQDWTYDDETQEGRLMIDEDLTENYDCNNFNDGDYYTNYVEDLWYSEHNPEENDLGSLENTKALNTNHGDKAVTFKVLMEGLVSDIVKAYTSIRDFCVRSGESLQSEDVSADDISRMLARAEKTSTYMCQVSDQLESILRRENTHKSIFQTLRSKEFANVVVEDSDMEDYRDFIGNCLEQGKILKESVKLVIQACKLKAA